MGNVQRYIVYTDGACSGNPGPGGWAFCVVADGFSPEEGGEFAEKGGVFATTSNQMELQAAIEALKWLTDNAILPCVICVRTDSKYVHGGMTEWLVRWKANRWRTFGKTPVANRAQWEELDQLAAKLSAAGTKVDWEWVEGHGDDRYNTEVDRMAVEAYKEFKEPKPRKKGRRKDSGMFLVLVPAKGTKQKAAMTGSNSRVRTWSNRAEAEAEARKHGGEVCPVGDNTVRVACPSAACGKGCESCAGLGYLDIRLTEPVVFQVCPKCGGAWKAHANAPWECVACSEKKTRREIASW